MKRNLHPTASILTTLLFIFMFSAGKLTAQTNVNFELGNFTGWTGTWGPGTFCFTAPVPAPTANAGFNQGVNNATPGSIPKAYQFIMTGGVDSLLQAYGYSCPVVWPGSGNYSARIGTSHAYGEGESISYSFLVTTANCNFTYHYAVSLGNGTSGHLTEASQPYFDINMTDGSGNAIACANYKVDGLSAGSIAGFINIPASVTGNGDAVYYKPWSSVFIPLNAYIGQTVKITFTTAACSPLCGGSHWAYAYLDADCSPLTLVASSPAICGGNTVTLTAPTGAATYAWTGPGVIAPANTQVVGVNQPGVYSVTMTTFGTNPCTFTIDTTITASPGRPVANFSSTTVCAGTPTTFTDLSTPNGSITSWAWDFNNDGTTDTTAQNPTHTFATPGVYPVKLSISWPPCAADTTLNVTVTAPPTSTFTATTPVCEGQNATVTYTGTAPPSATYNWSFSGGTVVSGTAAGPYQVHWANSGFQSISLGVTNNGCSSALTSTSVMVNAAPSSAFTATSPVCTGQAATITYSGTPSGTAAYTWVFNGGTLISGSGAGPYQVSWPAAGSKVLTLSVTDNGCTSSLDTTLVTVNAYPTATFTATSPVCAFQNTTITFTGSASVNATYHWNFAGGTFVSGTGAGPYQINWPTAGTENVTLSVTDNGCTSTLNTVPVTVNATPTAVFTTNTPVCTGQTSNIAYTGTGTNAAAYTWTFDGGTIVSGATQGPYVVSWNTAGAKNITLSVTENNCTSPLADSIVTVNATPFAAFSIAPPGACVGQTSTVSFTGTATNTAVYTWAFGSGTVTSGSGAGPYQITWPAAGAQSITLSITDNGCVSNDTATTFTVGIIPPSNAGADVRFCSGDSAAIGTASTTGYTYAWSPVTGLSNSTIANPEANGTNTGTDSTTTKYIVTTSQGGCSSSDSVLVTVYPVPVAVFTPGAAKCFTGNSFNFQAAGTYLTNATFAWNFGANGVPSTSTTANQTVSFTATGSQAVTLTVSQAGCTGNTFLDSVVVYPEPTATFTADTTLGCQNQQVCFTSTANVPINSYQWNFGDGNTSILQNPCTTYGAAGVYTVALAVVSSSGCTGNNIENNLITISAKAIAAFTPTNGTVQLPADTLSLNNLSANATNYIWNFGIQGGSTQVNPTITFTQPGIYPVTLYASNLAGCNDSVQHNVIVLPPTAYFIPNVFTPNADGNNDLFYIATQEGVTVIKFEIFDRWGEKVHDGTYPWDGTYRGKLCAQGVYVYSIELGLSGQDQGFMRKGTITLLR